MLSQILKAIQGLAQSTTTTQNDDFGLAPSRAHDGSWVRDGPPPVVRAKQNPANLAAPRAIDDAEKFMKNGAKEFLGGEGV